MDESSDGILQGLKRLIEQPALRERLGEGAAAAAQARFNARTLAEKTVQFYETLLA